MDQPTVLYPLVDTNKNKVFIHHPSAEPDAPPLYTFRGASKKSFNLFRGDTTGERIGIVTFHGLSSSIDVLLHGRTIELRTKASVGGSYAFADAAVAGGRELHWKKTKYVEGKDYELLDGEGRVMCACAEGEGLHMYVSVEDEALRDVIVATGMAVLLYGQRAKGGWIHTMLAYSGIPF